MFILEIREEMRLATPRQAARGAAATLFAAGLAFISRKKREATKRNEKKERRRRGGARRLPQGASPLRAAPPPRRGGARKAFLWFKVVKARRGKRSRWRWFSRRSLKASRRLVGRLVWVRIAESLCGGQSSFGQKRDSSFGRNVIQVLAETWFMFWQKRDSAFCQKRDSAFWQKRGSGFSKVYFCGTTFYFCCGRVFCCSRGRFLCGFVGGGFLLICTMNGPGRLSKIRAGKVCSAPDSFTVLDRILLKFVAPILVSADRPAGPGRGGRAVSRDRLAGPGSGAGGRPSASRPRGFGEKRCPACWWPRFGPLQKSFFAIFGWNNGSGVGFCLVRH